MGRFTGVLGLLTMLGLAYLFSTDCRAIKLKMVVWGLGLANRSRVSGVLLLDVRTDAFSASWAMRMNQMLAYAFVGSNLCLASWEKQNSVDRIYFRFSGAADNYFHRGALCAAVLLRRDAGGDSRGGVGDAARDGRQRSRIAQRGRQHLHGADRSAADDPAFSTGPHAIRTDDHHDQRNGARLRAGSWRPTSRSAWKLGIC